MLAPIRAALASSAKEADVLEANGPRFTEFDVPSEEELARAWGVHPRTVYKMALPFVYVGRHRFYPWARVVEEMRRRAK